MSVIQELKSELLAAEKDKEKTIEELKKEVLNYGNTPKSRASKYVMVCGWDSETKRRKTKTLRKDQFATVAELEDAIKKIRDTQKAKNARNKGKSKLNELMLKPLSNEPKLTEQEKKVAKRHAEQMLEIEEESLLLRKPLQVKDNIDLLLDPKTGNSCVIYGSSKRGKTTLMMHLYRKYYAKDKKFISTIFASNSQIPLYNKKDNKNLIVSTAFNAKSEKYIRLQKFINTKTNNRYKFLLMFDDMIDLKNKKLLSELVLSYRNSNISTIICLQYVYMLSKQNRANVNNIILFGCNSLESTVEMVKTFCADKFRVLGFARLDDQIAFYNKMTENYGFIYINNVRNTISFHRLDIRDM